MAKVKILYSCNECGAETGQWAGQCSGCGQWNTLVEARQVASTPRSNPRMRLAPASEVQTLDAIAPENIIRLSAGMKELDRVLGGGLVVGSVVLIGGDPGIGKSTLLLQALASVSENANVLYVSGEESAQQVALRAHRLGVVTGKVKLLAETRVDAVLDTIKKEQPQVVVIDSIQTMFTDAMQSAPGSVSQVRETAAQLVSMAKATGTALILIGHVTKEGALAGPRVLEHMVDAVLYFEGDSSSRFRIVRAIKNRFGAVNELGVFVMDESGLQEVNNPSAMFISRQSDTVPGSTILATQEGTRPLLVEVQALVDDTQLANPRRVCVGIDSNRLAMLLAVLHRHGGIATQGQDVFVNIAGGMRITETASDLAVVMAVVSSLRNRPMGNDILMFGELGLGGEIRPVQRGEERIQEAAKLGFTRAMVPQANKPRKKIKGIEILLIRRLSDALAVLD
ncbi:MAG: DNA repair protein RadA [Proteobacteria bacterium]|nr:DNA repair protein RadA [Pseudomonadota bacterium]